jgi:hypothetical protein
MNKGKKTVNDIDKLIKKRIYEILDDSIEVPDYDDVYTDTFAEIIEKIIIINTRQWYLEDELGKAVKRNNNNDIAEIKKKMDILFKIKRPALLNALDKMIIQISRNKINYTADENLKLYKGYQT